MSWFLAAAVVLSWILAGFWTVCAIAALRGLRRVPNLAPLPAGTTNSGPDMLPKVTVIVPARNEASAVEACLRSLLAQTIPLEVFAVNDRSTDATGAILDNLAAQPQPPGKVLRVLHVEALPDGWLGKPHAMALAARQAATPWLLFTDADVLFAPEVIERALAEAEPHADHLVLMPTLILHSGGERMMTAFFQSLSLIWWRPWRVADPRARESIGIGAFNLIRAGVYRAVGGFEAQRYQVLDDVRLGVEVKRAGFRQRVVFGLDLIRVHWAPGALGMARNLTKNLYAGFSFSPLLLLGACLGLTLLCYGPLLDLAVPWTRYGSALRAAGVVSVVLVALHYRLASHRFSRIRLAYVLTMPLAGALVLYAMLRSMIVTVARGGIVWRGTFYPLRELRRRAGPLR